MGKYWKYLILGAVMFLLGTAAAIATGEMEGKASASGEPCLVG